MNANVLSQSKYIKEMKTHHRNATGKDNKTMTEL